MKDSAVGLLVWVAIIAAVIYWGDIWNSKWRYSLFRTADLNRITILKEPHDCDFMRAPIGSKGCHCEKSVTVTKWATSTKGSPIVSYDDGKNWEAFTPDPGVKGLLAVPNSRVGTLTSCNLS
jgi:hypothetical protein